MTELKQSRYKIVVRLIAWVIVSFMFCLMLFNVLGGSITNITLDEWLCSLAASVGIDIIFFVIYYKKFTESNVKLYEDCVVYRGKSIKYTDILDVNIDSTYNRNVKKVYINSATEQFIFILGSNEFNVLFQLLPVIQTKNSEDLDDIKIDIKGATDTLLVMLVNSMLYLTLGLIMIIAIVITLKKSNGSDLVHASSRAYIWYSAAAIWVAVLLIECFIYLFKRIRFNRYMAQFHEDCVTIVFGNKIINNREIKKANVNGVNVKQSLVGRIAGKYRVKLITDSIGGGTNEFDYFPYLLNEEQKDAVLKHFLGEESVEVKCKRSNVKSNVKSYAVGVILSAFAVVLSVFYSWMFFLTLLPIWYVIIQIMFNKKFATIDDELIIVGYGIKNNMLYFKRSKTESLELRKDLIDKLCSTTIVTIYLYGYKEQLYLGCFDDDLAQGLTAKLKK